MKSSNEQIAKDFSMGNFEPVFPFLSDNIEWKIIGENCFKGKSEVLSNCEQTKKYFDSVETKFKLETIVSNDSNVVIIGTAEFLRDGKRISFVHASDFYEFNKDGMLEKISSYCISEK